MKKQSKKKTYVNFMSTFIPSYYSVYAEDKNGDFYCDSEADTCEDLIADLANQLTEEMIDVDTLQKGAYIYLGSGGLTTKIFGITCKYDIDFYDYANDMPIIMDRDEIIKAVKEHPNYKVSLEFIKQQKISRLENERKIAESEVKDAKRKLKEYMALKNIAMYQQSVAQHESDLKDIENELKTAQQKVQNGKKAKQ